MSLLDQSKRQNQRTKPKAKKKADLRILGVWALAHFPSRLKYKADAKNQANVVVYKSLKLDIIKAKYEIL